MMFDYLGGMLGEENRGSRAAKVVRVIIAGNSLAVTEVRDRVGWSLVCVFDVFSDRTCFV